jgi:hypothetical protein
VTFNQHRGGKSSEHDKSDRTQSGEKATQTETQQGGSVDTSGQQQAQDATAGTPVRTTDQMMLLSG